jgi:hypothetical protein
MPNDLQSTEHSEKLFRSDENTRTTERLRAIFGEYVMQNENYKAYSLAFDYYKLAKPMLDELAENYEHDFLYAVFIVFCCEADKDRAIALAVMLVDEYKQTAEYVKIMAVGRLLFDTFRSPRGTTPSVLIMKEAINAALSLVEGIADTFPSDETVTRICETMSCLPMCFADGEFMLLSLHRIAACYGSEYHPKLVTIAYFLPSLKQGFGLLQKHFEGHVSVGGMNSETLQGVIDVCAEYSDILFSVDYPQLVDAEPYKLNDKTEVDKHLNMLREEQNVTHELLNLTDETRHKLPELQKRYERLIHYFSHESGEFHKDIEVTCHLAFCVAAWRKEDVDFAIKEIEPYAKKLLELVADDSVPTGAIYSIQTTLTYMSEIYAYAKDVAKEYECHLKFLELCNVYLKRICFENGIDYFLANTQEEYFFYHYALASAVQIAQEHDFSVDKLYFELCKRKNIFYLGEMWQKQGRSTTEIHKLLKKDFSFEELKAAIPGDSMLYDFFYARVMYMDEPFDENDVESRNNSNLIVFSLKSSGSVNLHVIADGVQFAKHVMPCDDWESYFKWITKRTFADMDDISRLIVCTDGDVNKLSISALPYQDGIIADYFTVRNIASIHDVVYPRPIKQIQHALIVAAPEFGGSETNDDKVKYPALSGSMLEKDLVENILGSEYGLEVETLTDILATSENIKSNLSENQYNIVHISTHGKYEDGNVHLITARANVSDDNTSISDEEVGKFAFEDTSLVVYALCYGARQTLSLQDSLSGFIKASLLSGANTIVAPIAPVDDFISVIFVSEFYKAYLTNKSNGEHNSPEYAFQQAVLNTRRLCGISKAEFLENYGVEAKEEYPLKHSDDWAKWVCFSAEEMK